MIRYGVDLHSLVYPKWAKIRFKISARGKLILVINPSLTPGKMPEGIKGMVPKGTKIFDYDETKECLISLSLNECMRIIDFVKAQKIADNVDIIHVLHGDKKILKFSWGIDASGTINLCNINYIRKSADDSEKSKLYVPVPFDGLREMVTVINSYVSNYLVLKMLCLADMNVTEDISQMNQRTNYPDPNKFKKGSELPDFEEEAAQ